MIVGNDRSDIHFSMMISHFDTDKGLVRRLATASDTVTLNHHIQRALDYGRKDIAQFLSESLQPQTGEHVLGEK